MISQAMLWFKAEVKVMRWVQVEIGAKALDRDVVSLT
jgi:hypothetical protein